MKSEFKDILKVCLPHICGDPIIRIEFDLKSEFLIISLPSNRIYNIKYADIMNRKDEIVTIKCYNKSELFIYSDFDLLQNIYYYPFISSIFSLDHLVIESGYEPRLEITITDDFKSLSFLSYVQDAEGIIHYKEKETWANNKGTFYFPLFNKSRFKFTLRATGRSINYGLIHTILPILIFLFGLLLQFGKLPKAVTDNSSSILFAVLLTFTPFYIGILQNFMAKSFMSLNLGMALYAKSYLISVIFIAFLIFLPNITIYLVLFEIIWLLLFLLSIRSYFSRGKFNHLIDCILYKPIIFFIQKRYSRAWVIQKRQQ